ncbi:MAG: ArsI/CadI family heavy metal resistance metalloenzyme [Panacagrimonas sp.]
MNRFHVHVSVKDLDESIRFYSNLFGVEPSVTKADYAKWMLEDPRINFAISHNRCGDAYGVNHLGLQVDSDAELSALELRFAEAGLSGVQEHGAACCYAKSDKTWLQDPQGIAWENFHTLGSVPVFGGHGAALAGAGGSCTPTATSCTPSPATTKSAGTCGPNAAPNCCG